MKALNRRRTVKYAVAVTASLGLHALILGYLASRTVSIPVVARPALKITIVSSQRRTDEIARSPAMAPDSSPPSAFSAPGPSAPPQIVIGAGPQVTTSSQGEPSQGQGEALDQQAYVPLQLGCTGQSFDSMSEARQLECGRELAIATSDMRRYAIGPTRTFEPDVLPGIGPPKPGWGFARKRLDQMVSVSIIYGYDPDNKGPLPGGRTRTTVIDPPDLNLPEPINSQ
jgi:hypothetical protein